MWLKTRKIYQQVHGARNKALKKNQYSAKKKKKWGEQYFFCCAHAPI